MNALGHGVTPKMKPIPARRSVVVAALDVGSSKVVCLIGRLRPRGPQQVLRNKALREDFGVNVRRGQHQRVHLEVLSSGRRLGHLFGRQRQERAFAEIARRAAPGRRTHLHVQLAQRGSRHVRAAAVRDDVHPLDLRKVSQSQQQLLEMKHRKLAGFAIVGVTGQAALACWPGERDRHSAWRAVRGESEFSSARRSARSRGESTRRASRMYDRNSRRS